jgi:hypothetical protein
VDFHHCRGRCAGLLHAHRALQRRDQRRAHP